jgi:hypothetical protein
MNILGLAIYIMIAIIRMILVHIAISTITSCCLYTASHEKFLTLLSLSLSLNSMFFSCFTIVPILV